ncbi:MAG: VWA domain-containing protein [Bacteroidota bacterium]
MEFAYPGFLYLLIILVPMIVWYVLQHRKISPAIQTSGLEAFRASGISFREILRHVLFGFRVIAIALLIVVMARPQSTDNWQNVTTEGIDIVLSLDISGSMLALDFKPDRLEAAKDVGTEFISGRPDDRIGLVVFSGESFTQCPLTTDHSVLINLMKDLKSGMIEDGTAIGMGLATAVNRLKESKAKSKVIILLTDGVNNRGSIAPVTAAEIARTFGIRVYTIGVGTKGTAPYPVQGVFGTTYQNMEVNIDEETLQDIADKTGGQYFRATDNQKLKDIYSEIDQLEKSRIDVTEHSKKEEQFFLFGVLAGIAILLEIIGRYLILKNIP